MNDGHGQCGQSIQPGVLCEEPETTLVLWVAPNGQEHFLWFCRRHAEAYVERWKNHAFVKDIMIVEQGLAEMIRDRKL